MFIPIIFNKGFYTSQMVSRISFTNSIYQPNHNIKWNVGVSRHKICKWMFPPCFSITKKMLVVISVMSLQWIISSQFAGKTFKNLSQTPLTPKKNGPTHSCNFVCLPSSLILELKLVNLHTIKMKLLHISSDFQLPLPSKKRKIHLPIGVWITGAPGTNLQKIKTQVEGKQMSHEKTKKTASLSIESWLFNRDPYFMVLWNPHKSPYKWVVFHPQQIP